MLSALSKAYLVFAALGAAAAVVYVVGTGGDHMGATLLVTLFVAGLAFAAATSLRPVTDTDLEVLVPEGAPPPARHPVADPGPSTSPTLFPFAAAAGITILGVGLTTGLSIIVLGSVVTALAGAGWLGRSWRDHPLWTARFGRRVGDRAVGPFSYPVVALVLGAIVAFSISRLYLAISESAAVVVSVLIAAFVLGGAVILSAGRNVGARLTGLLAAVALVSVLAAGVAGYAAGERTIRPHESKVYDAYMAAEGVAFTKDRLEVPAGKVRFSFANHDPAGVYHDLGVYSLSPGAGVGGKSFVPGRPFFAVLPIPGGTEDTAVVDTEAVGLEVGREYQLRCDFHPGMRATLVVVAAPAGEKKGEHKE